MATRSRLHVSIPLEGARPLLLLPEGAASSAPPVVVHLGRDGGSVTEGPGTQPRALGTGEHECAGWLLEVPAAADDALGRTLEERADPLPPELRVARSPRPEEVGRRVLVRHGATVTIGRGPECTLVLADTLISARHAQVTPTPRGCELEDLGSTNGTFVRGQRIRKRRLLGDGDEIVLGDTTLEFVAVRAAFEAAASRSRAASAAAAREKDGGAAATPARGLRSLDWLLLGSAAFLLMATVLLGAWLWLASGGGPEPP